MKPRTSRILWSLPFWVVWLVMALAAIAAEGFLAGLVLLVGASGCLIVAVFLCFAECDDGAFPSDDF
jgi:hypothetical protein